MSLKTRAKRRRLGAAWLGGCLLLVCQPIPGIANSSTLSDPDAKSGSGPAFSAQAARLLGIYEAVPVGDKIPGASQATPATLDALPLSAEAAKAQATLAHTPDPKDLCQVLGPFRLMARPDNRFEILHDAPNKLVLLFQDHSWGHVRTIGIDAEHIKDFTKVRPMWNGDSIAKWDDDTLVVDTIHFTNKTWLNEKGVMNSKQLHLTERFRLLDGDKYLEYRATAVDPEVLNGAVSYTRYYQRSTREISASNCFARILPHLGANE